MTMKTFKQALTHIDSEYLIIGGGEPTLHPKLFEMIGIGISKGFYGEHLYMVTNGSQKDIMYKLSNMAKDGIMKVLVSNDQYHPPLDLEVKKWFTKSESSYGRSDRDFRGFNGERCDPIRTGRAKELAESREGVCCCEGPFIVPNGDVYQCGCDERIKIGDVFNGFEYIKYDEDGEGDEEVCSKTVIAKREDEILYGKDSYSSNPCKEVELVSV